MASFSEGAKPFGRLVFWPIARKGSKNRLKKQVNAEKPFMNLDEMSQVKKISSI
jgi:hypothetical protein